MPIATTTAGLKRSSSPHISGVPAFSEAVTTSSVSTTDGQTGFSISSGSPASMIGSAREWWYSVGAARTAASTPARPSRSAAQVASYISAVARPFCSSGSMMTESWVWAPVAITRAWLSPIDPHPTRAIRSDMRVVPLPKRCPSGS